MSVTGEHIRDGSVGVSGILLQDFHNVAHGISLTEQIRIFQDFLVGVEAVNTQTDIEQQGVDGELILEIEGHVNRLIRTDVVCSSAVGTNIVEEVSNRSFVTIDFSCMIITIVAY